jgi:transposase-like protein DUF772
MAHKKMGQASFVGHSCGPTWARTDAWSGWIGSRLGAAAGLVRPVRSGAWGRPSYPPLAMLKVLLLQRWYSLSNEGVEEALADRLWFRRFCGFALDDERPDAKTICRFRLAPGRC